MKRLRTAPHPDKRPQRQTKEPQRTPRAAANSKTERHQLMFNDIRKFCSLKVSATAVNVLDHKRVTESSMHQEKATVPLVHDLCIDTTSGHWSLCTSLETPFIVTHD